MTKPKKKMACAPSEDPDQPGHPLHPLNPHVLPYHLKTKNKKNQKNAFSQASFSTLKNVNSMRIHVCTRSENLHVFFNV